MAELVERHLESMIEEIQEMQRLKLYSVAETKAILKTRKMYETKVNGPIKNKQDFNDYIKFEQDVLEDIKLRRSKLRIVDKKSGIEVRIMKRIKHLFEIAIQRFSNDFELSLTYFKFCKESNYIQSASLVVQNMIKNFAYIADVWQVAASWFMKKDVKQALSLIHKGLIIHPSSSELYIQAIELELLTKEKDDWPDEPEKAQKLEEICYNKIDTYVETMFQNVKNYKCLVSVLETLDPHNFVLNIKHKIIEQLMTLYYNEERVWQILAEREKNGYHYPLLENPKNTTKFLLQRSMEKYEEGIKRIDSHKRKIMWALYFDYLIDLNQQNGVSNNFVRTTLIKKLDEAKEASLLAEKYFIIWAKLLTEEKEILRVVGDGLKAFPTSVDLWKLKLRCLVMKDDVEKMNVEFKTGYLALKEKAGPLWTMIIRYHMLSSPNKLIEIIFKDAVKQPEEISNLIKPDYIEWVALNKDIESAREVYKSLANNPPFCRELHTKMHKLETNELNISIKDLDLPLKLACQQFGKKDADVWIELRDIYYQYIHLFQEGYDNFDINQQIAKIRKEAEEALMDNPIMLADFRDKFDSPVNIDG